MSFERYMDEQIPTWRTDISLDVLSGLKKKYDKVEMWQRSIDTINNNVRNHNKSGLDYSNDLEKCLGRLNSAQAAFYSEVAQIRAAMNESLSDQKHM